MDGIRTTSATQDRVSHSRNPLILIKNLQRRSLGIRCPGLFGTNKK